MNLDILKASAEDGMYMVMSQVAEFIPQFVGFLCIVFLGYILAIIIKKSVAFFSKKYKSKFNSSFFTKNLIGLGTYFR